MFLTVMSASCTLRGFAQDARGAINDVLDSFTLPVFGGFMLGGIILGLIQQWDNIIDKENRGTRKEGFVALGWYVGFALLACSRSVRRKECHLRHQPVDMRYKVRKDWRVPCMIRGLLSGDYWIFVGCCSAAFVPVLPRHPCGGYPQATGTCRSWCSSSRCPPCRCFYTS